MVRLSRTLSYLPNIGKSNLLIHIIDFFKSFDPSKDVTLAEVVSNVSVTETLLSVDISK